MTNDDKFMHFPTLTFALLLIVASASAQTAQFPNINVRTNASAATLTIASNATFSGSSTIETNAAATITRTFTGTAAAYPITLLLRNPGDTVGGSDYQNQVHLRLQAGTTNDHRAYLNFANYAGVDKWITGRNALDAWVLYSTTDSLHRMYLNNAAGNGMAYFNAAGTGAVQLNNTRENTGTDIAGTGGFEVFDGGAYPSLSVFKVSPGDSSSLLSATSDGSGYAPASLKLTATQADYRGGGIFYHNDVSKSSWFYGAPYTNGTARWSINFSSNAVWSSTLAQARYSLLTVLSNGNVGIGLEADAPSEKLEVDGNIKATGSLMLGTNVLSFDASNNLFWNGKQVTVAP